MLRAAAISATSSPRACRYELVLDRRRATFDTPALALNAITDDLGETADTAVGKFRLQSAMTPGPGLDHSGRLDPQRALNILQLRITGQRAQRVMRECKWKCHFQSALELERQRLRSVFPMGLLRLDTADAVRRVDDSVANGQA